MIRIGIIGCGKIAQVRHLPEYAANPHVELAGYYDLNTQRAQEMAAQYGGKVYESYFDLLNDPSIDAVSICVENRSHARYMPSDWRLRMIGYSSSGTQTSSSRFARPQTATSFTPQSARAFAAAMTCGWPPSTTTRFGM